MQNDTGDDLPEKFNDERRGSLIWSEALLVVLFLGLVVILGLAVQHISSTVPH